MIQFTKPYQLLNDKHAVFTCTQPNVSRAIAFEMRAHCFVEERYKFSNVLYFIANIPLI